MFLAIILGYAMAAIFALCGLFNSIAYCAGETPSDAYLYLTGLASAATPLVYAALMLLLIQIATQLERLAIHTEISLLKAHSKTKTATPKPGKNKAHGTVYVPKSSEHHTKDEEPHYFLTSEPEPSQEQEEPAKQEAMPDTTPSAGEGRHFFKTH